MVGTRMTKNIFNDMIPESAQWRDNIAHDVKYVDRSTLTSLATMVCGEVVANPLTGSQVHIVKA